VVAVTSLVVDDSRPSVVISEALAWSPKSTLFLAARRNSYITPRSITNNDNNNDKAIEADRLRPPDQCATDSSVREQYFTFFSDFKKT